jgi:calcium/calmodulin-dependent protein kinase I
MGACLNTPKPSSTNGNAPKPFSEGNTNTGTTTTAGGASMQQQPQQTLSADQVSRIVGATNGGLQPSSEQEFKQRYQLKGVLGNGNYSVVRKGLDLQTNGFVAIKVVDRRKLTKDDELSLRIEVEVLSKLNHPNIIKMFGWYAEGKQYFIVTELMNGGELFDRIVKKEFYSEREAQKVVLTLASVIKFIHDQGIVHRDLKPENILLTDDTDNATIKIADFGFARPVAAGLNTACGTPGYVAPEIINGRPYGKSVDIWSLGVIIYILLCGYPPFYNTNQTQLFKAIREGRFAFDSPYWDPISENAKDLIKKCLTVDVHKRLDIDGIIHHPWLATEAEARNLTNTLGELKKFNAKRKLRAAIKAAIAANKLMDIAEQFKSGAKLQQQENAAARNAVAGGQ